MTDLKQLTEDSFASAMRRNPNPRLFSVLQKIHEEFCELEDVYLSVRMSAHCPELLAVEEELADIIFSCLVFARCENIDIEKALKVKNEFNITRL
jgi:NTP pyrophosphatase (non-canonical NTP hydrolase)